MTLLLQKSGKKTWAKNLLLGLNISNNGSACLLENGKPVFYLEAERLSYKKHDFDIRWLLDKLPDCDIKHVAVSDAYWKRGDKQVENIKMLAAVKRKYPGCRFYDYRKDHHLTHAACGFYNSGFESATCIVVDSNGSKTSAGLEIESMFFAPTWEVIHKTMFSPDNIGFGRRYEMASSAYGWHYMDAGKVMGKSAYDSEPAKSLQREWQERVLELVSMAPTDEIVFAGGCFLNCVANYNTLKKFPNKKLYAEPLAHDGGTAMGAAYLAYHAND